MKKSNFTKKLRYQFDNLMSRGTGTLLLSLAVISVIILVIISFGIWSTNTGPTNNFLELLWLGLMRSIDAGNIGGDEGCIFYIALMFITTLFGIFILSVLIGILTAGIESKLESLRKGRSKVIEKNHTIILGWSEQIFTILEELIEANSSVKRSCIVIMGNRDKSEMDDAIRERIKDFKTTNIVTRQGNPIDIDDLEIVNLNSSRSIIIILENDISIIKTILAITNNPNKRSEPYHIVSLLKNPKNIQVAQIAGNNQVEIVLNENLLARVIAQTCRQHGLSIVYSELLSFVGNEIYFNDCPYLVGKKFSETIQLFDTSTVIGIYSKGISHINPSMDTIFSARDKLIVISADDDTVIINENNKVDIDDSLIVKNPENSSVLSEKTLILGWNNSAPIIIRELDNYVAKSSLVTIVATNTDMDAIDLIKSQVKQQKVEVIHEDPINRAILDDLVKKDYNHIIILSNDTLEIQESDGNTLIILLHLRDIADKTSAKFSLVSEMHDIRNRKLAKMNKFNDFIISEKLISQILTQISENKNMNSLFLDLFSSDNSELYLRPANNYIVPNYKISYHTLVESAIKKSEVVIGYQLEDEMLDESKNYGFYLNPNKKSLILLGEKDFVIVLREK